MALKATDQISLSKVVDGKDGTSVTILGSYNTMADLEAAHPTGSLGDAYMVSGDLVVWNGSAWENVGRIQGPQGPQGQAGNQGVSIASVTNYYLATSASSGVTRSTSGWTTTVQSMTATNQYLWNYEVITGSNGQVLNTTDPVIIGRYGQNGTNGTNGQNGQNGVGIRYITEHYQVSSSDSTAPSTWSDTPVNTDTTNKYLWNYETITYTDNVSVDTVPRIIGTHGATGPQGGTGPAGSDGISVTSVQPQYYLSTSSSSATGGSWGTTITYVSGKYIWTRSKNTYSDGSVDYSTEIYNEALTQACQNALTALAAAQEVNQYAWHTETDTGTGAGTHITAIPQEDFEADPNNGGLNALFNTAGMLIRKGLKALASYGLKTVIGDKAGTRVEIQNDAIEMLDENDVRAFRVKNGTQTQQVQVVKNVSTFQFISDGTSGTYTLPATPVAGTPIIVTLTREGTSSNVTATFTFPYGTAYDNTISGMRVVYNGNLAITVTNVTGTGLDILGGTVEYTQLTTNSVVEIPATMLIQDEDFTKFLFNPQFSVDGLSPYNSRVEYDYDGLDGGYIDIGKWRYVHLPMELNTTLSASNYYAIVGGFAVPAGLTGYAALSAFSPKNGGVYSAYINSDGRLCVVTGATRLVTEDVLVVSGWYLKA